MKLKRTSDYLAVIPSIRNFPMDYYEPLKDVDILIIDDSNALRVIQQPEWHNGTFTVIDHEDRPKVLPHKVNTLIPYNSPSCKNIGLWVSYVNGYEYTILLDDDCDLRETPNYVNEIPVGQETIMTVISQTKTLDNVWFNPMELLQSKDFSRGFPYEYRNHEPLFDGIYSRKVKSKFNEGLWWGMPDINGVDKFYRDYVDIKIRPNIEMNVVVDPLIYVPISIMNVQIHHDLIPAFYQPPNYKIYGDFYVKRHDDVWAGMVLKYLMDYHGDSFTVGNPLNRHVKVADPMWETKSETVTNIIQHHLENALNSSSLILGNNYAESAVSLVDSIDYLDPLGPGIYANVLRDYFNNVKRWAELFL